MLATEPSGRPEDWAEIGQSFFDSGQFSDAMDCFERAGMTFEKSVAWAYHLRQEAINTPRSGVIELRKRKFMKAAEEFFKCADLWSHQKRYYRISAECFVEAHAYKQAALTYKLAQNFTEAARNFRKANMFDEAIELVRTRKQEVDPNVATSIIGASRLYYIRNEEPL